MTSHSTLSPLLALPRELRDDILGYLTVPEHVYTSSTTKDTHHLYRSRRASGETYIDTRIYLPSRPPANILATCRQLRQECLEQHIRLLNSSSRVVNHSAKEPMSNVLAERLGSEFAEEAERACDDGTLRITLEIQRQLRGQHGYYIPVRDDLSPRFLALLPLIRETKKLRLAIWPGFDWWNGGPQPFIDKRGNAHINPDVATKPNAASIAISKVLDHLPHVEELSVDVLMQASDGYRWDLPDRKWESVQPWMDSAITPDRKQMAKITRKLVAFWSVSVPEPFYTQHETRQDAGKSWKIERKGDMATPSMKSMCNEEDLEFLRSLAVEETYVRAD